MQESRIPVTVGQDVHLVCERHVSRPPTGRGNLVHEHEVLPGWFGHVVTFAVLWQGVDQRMSDLVLRSPHGLDDSRLPNVCARRTSGGRIQGQHSNNRSGTADWVVEVGFQLAVAHGTTLRKYWGHELTLRGYHGLVSQHQVGLVRGIRGARRQVGDAGWQRDEREAVVELHGPGRPRNGLVVQQHGVAGVFAEEVAGAVGSHDEVDIRRNGVDTTGADVIQNREGSPDTG